MRRPARLLTASALFAALALGGCLPMPPSPMGADRAALELEAEASYEYYMLALTSASELEVADAAIFEAIATPEVAAGLARDTQAIIDAGAMLDGTPTTLSFDLVDNAGIAEAAAHVCTDPSSIRLIDRASGAELAWDDAETFRQMLVVFERAENRELVVAGRGPYEEQDRSCP